MFSRLFNKIRKNKFTVLITVFVIGLITITLGSALLNSILTLTGNTKIKENKWLIHFEFVDNIHASHPNTDSSLDARITDPTTKKENISFTTKFQEVGDFYEFNVYTWNEGTIDAVIDSLEFNVPNEYKNNIELSAHYDDQDIKTTDTVTYDVNKVKNIYDSRYDYSKTEIKPCDPLYKDTMRKIIVRAEYKKELENLTADKNITFNVKINYVQEKTCEDSPSTKRLLRIRPNGGKYNKTTTETKIYLSKDETYTVKTPTRDMYNFEGWEVISPTENGTYTFTNNIFTMGDENVILQAKWAEGDYVARIMNKYYPTIQEAFDDVDSKNWEDNTVWLLKDTTEYPTNRATHEFTFNLDGHTVTGTIQNNEGSTISLINGTIITEEELDETLKENLAVNLRHEAAFINYGTVKVGQHDGIVYVENSIALIGNDYGLINNGSFEFYDGYLEGRSGFSKEPNMIEGLATNPGEKNKYGILSEGSLRGEKVYLSPTPNRAVARIELNATGGKKYDSYYYNLQNAFDHSALSKKNSTDGHNTDNDFIVYAIRDFEAAAPVTVSNEQRIFFNTSGYDIRTGEDITNNGYLKIYNSDTNNSLIRSSVSITNNKDLVIDNVSITSTTDDNVIENKANLTLSKTTITGKNGYGINNTDNSKIIADNNTVVKSDSTYGLNNESTTLVLSNGNYYGINNSGTLEISGTSNVYKSENTEAIRNSETINMTGGNVSDDTNASLINNWGTMNISGGTITNKGIAIDGSRNSSSSVYGTVNVSGGTITSTDKVTIKTLTANVSGGEVNNTNANAIEAENATLSGTGEVNSENARGISVSRQLDMTGGKVNAGTIGLYGNLVNISGGEVVSGDVGAQTYTYYTYYPTVEHRGTVTINGENAHVEGANYGVYTDYIEMSKGLVTSNQNVGVAVNKDGNITGGKIHGATYGVLDNAKVTIGIDDNNISVTSPEIIGDSYGLFIPEGKEATFNDGILKGTIDGYSGIITGTPKGAVTVDGTDTIDEVLYQTDYLIVYEPWLEIEGKGTYNTIDDACNAFENGDVIKVIKSVDDSSTGLPHITFKQHFIGEDKEIVFDLNGHTVRSTQPIYNNTTTTIIDSSENETGTFKPKYGSSIVNDKGYTLTLNGGKYLSDLKEVVTNNGKMIVEKAYFDVDDYGIFNHKELIINDINIARSRIGIRQNETEDESIISGSTTMNGGIINASENGLQTAETWYQSYSVTLNGGKIIAGKNGISGSNGTKTVNGGEIIATEYGVYSSDTQTIVTGGKITSLTKDGIFAAGGIHVTGGTIIGKEYGIRNEWHPLPVNGEWCDITIEGGHIIGQTKDGLNNGGTSTYSNNGGADLLITGGKIEGKLDGVYTRGTTTLGDDDGSISKTTPELVGHTKYALETTKYTAFYDGILKAIPDTAEGKLDVYKGLISIIPTGAVIFEDYENYQNSGVEYQTRYLETKGNWLQIGDDESRQYNSFNTAYAAMTENDTTIKVILSAYIDFKQKISGEKDVIIDLNGHTVDLTQPIEIGANVKVIDSKENGYWNNIRDELFTINGNGILTIDSGTYNSETDCTINNINNLIINNGTITSKNVAVCNNRNATINNGTITGVENGSAIRNFGSLTINNGNISSENSDCIYNSDSVTINNSNIAGKYGVYNSAGSVIINDVTMNTTNKAIQTWGTTTINGGNIKSTGDHAIAESDGLLNVNGGTIISENGNGIYSYGSAYKYVKTNITDGEIRGSLNGLYVDGSSISYHNYVYLKVSGGHIVGQSATGITTNLYSEITGGVIEGNTNGLVTKYYTVLGEDDGSIVIDKPVIKGELYGVYIDSGTFNFYDGILKGITERINDYEKVNAIPKFSQIMYDQETIDEKLYLTAYLYQEQDIARNLKSGKTCDNAVRVDDGICIYNNLELAFEDVSDGETIQILESAIIVPIYYDITNSKDVTLDLNGKTLTSTKNIINNGKLNITDTSSEHKGTIRTSANKYLITNNNELTLGNITLSNKATSYSVVYGNGKLTLNNTNIDAKSGIYCRGELNVNNAIINVDNTAIEAYSKTTITGGTYTGNYSLYISTSQPVSVENVTLNGAFYDNGNNTTTVKDTIANKGVQNNATMVVEAGTKNTKFNGGLYNNGTFTGNSIEIYTYMNNYGRLTLNESKYEGSASSVYSSNPAVSINNYNNAIMTLNNSNLKVNASGYVNALNNAGTVNFNENSTLTITGGRGDTGIYNTGNVNISSGTITVNGSSNAKGIYSNAENAKSYITSGKIDVTGGETYGVYINYGTFEMGVKDGSGLPTADVSKTNPIVSSTGARGIGIKKINGFFNFYDGIIWGSKYAKPDTTSNAENKYEATTYLDEDTGYEYTILEYMPYDYAEDEVATVRDVAYKSLQSAIDHAEEGDVIKVVRNINESVNISSTKNVVINLNKHTVTGKVTNNGNLTVYNGTINNFDDTTVVNTGTFIMGDSTDPISSANIRIVSEKTAIENTGTFAMYDGYIEGNPSINGDINTIPPLSRIRTSKNDQRERKTLQSLDEQSIIDGETDLRITIDPNTGYYDNRNVVQEVYLQHLQTYDLNEHTIEKFGCDFDGWEVSDPDAYNNGVITVNLSDITVKAKWKVKDTTVAQIGTEYYESLADAIFHAKRGDKVILLKDTTEDVTNDKDITIDLNEHKVTGAFINNGTLVLINGTIENTQKIEDASVEDADEVGIGIINNKSLTLGINDEDVSTTSVKVIGTTYGIKNNSRLIFYDGYIEGEIGLLGNITRTPLGYSLYTIRVTEGDKIKQRIYLTGNPENAVAETRAGGTQFYFNLNDAIATARITGSEIYIVQNFEAPYDIEIPQDTNIVINTESHKISTGKNIINNGTLKLYNHLEDEENSKGTIELNGKIINNGTMTLQDIDVSQTGTTNRAIENHGKLDIKNSIVTSKSTAAVYTDGDLSIDKDTELKAESVRALYSAQEKDLVLDKGYIGGITIDNKVIVEEGTTVKTTASNLSAVVLNSDTASFVMNDGILESAYKGIEIKGKNTKIDINGGTITTVGNAIYQDLYYGNDPIDSYVKITGGIIETTGNNTTTIYLYPRYKNTKLIINGGTIKNNKYYVIYAYYTDITIDGSAIIDGRAESNYATILLDNSSNCVIKNGTIKSENSFAIYSNTYSNLTIEGGNISSNSPDYDAIRFYGTKLIISGGNINSSNVGLNLYSGSLDMSGGSIVGFEQGVKITNSNIKTNITGGTISGLTYGLNIDNANNTINIGSVDKDLSTSDPYISGGLYGIYNNKGASVNFYNGKLRGITNGYSNNLSAIRRGHNVQTEQESDNIYDSGKFNNLTYNISETSEEATSNKAKIGDGYARITYIGESNGSCVSGMETNITYTGTEETFTSPCTGKYKLEVWGAQGGNSLCNGTSCGTPGYGGYAVGEITLNSGEKVYINVGGKGETGRLDTCAAGGYNGGGKGNNDNRDGVCGAAGDDEASGGGGGATHIAFKSGLLSSLKNDKDKVIIVAGGGGGSSYTYTAGSGGGFAGGKTDKTTSKIPSQYLGYEFGQGQDGLGYNYNSSGVAGGGGGWYGGFSQNKAYYESGTGGSGYISNTRLSNAAMYGYNVQTYANGLFINYLTEKDRFLKVNEITYNNFEDAIEAAGTEGTIYLLKDIEASEAATFLADTNVTFDLNGFKITNTQSIINNGTLTITDSSSGKTGELKTTGIETIINKGTKLTVDGIKISSTDTTAILAKTGTGIIDIKNNTEITGKYAVYSEVGQTINIESATINTTNSSIVFHSGSSKLNITYADITSSDTAIYFSTGYNTVVIDDININAKNGFYSAGYYSNIITVNNGTINTSNYVIYFSSPNTSNQPTATIKGGTYTSPNNTIFNSGGVVSIDNATVKTTSTSEKAIVTSSYGTTELKNGAKVLAPSSTAIEMKNNSSSYKNILTIDSAEISAGKTAIETTANSTINYNSGSIDAEDDGIVIDNSSADLNLGDKTKELSIIDPVIKSKQTAVKVTNGNFNFYNGRLKGITAGYSGIIKYMRKGHKIYTTTEVDNNEEYTVNYLTTREGFLEVNGETYNSLEDAIGAIETTGTITVLNSDYIYEDSTIPSGKNITLDLAGNTITSTAPIYNNGEFTITDSSNSKNGELITNSANPLINNGTSLTVNGTKITSSTSSAVYAKTGTGTVTVNNNSVLTGTNGVLVSSNQKINIDNTTINATNNGIGVTSSTKGIDITNVDITATNTGISIESSYNKFVINTITINAKKGLISSGYRSNDITINDGTITTSEIAIQFTQGSRPSYTDNKLNINGGTYISDQNALFNTSSYTVIENATLKGTSANYSTIYSNDYVDIKLNSGTKIISEKTTGIYMINDYSKDLTINGAEIESKDNGISTSTSGTITMNSGKITSESVGINVRDYPTTVNIYGGEIKCGVYGVKLTANNSTLNIGNSSEEVSTSSPYIEGDINALNNPSGNVNFYSGKLKGGIEAHTNSFNNIKPNYEVTYENDATIAQTAKTYSTSSLSTSAESNTPKEGNGYARITYISNNDEGSITCDSQVGKEYIFKSTKEVQDFTANCKGKYKLEAWGAQGGYRSNSNNGGKGGYSTGIVTLNRDDKLYVYVGASGNNGGYNGGGSRETYSGGGGASDIRLVQNDLYTRIIVAGGGGSDGASSRPGGYAGGLVGESRNDSYGTGGTGGTQTSGGTYRAEFGIGGSGNNASNGYAGAGGGGWYGGGGANPDTSGDDDRGGGGGSSFVYDDNATLPSGYNVDSRFKLTDTTLKAGNEEMPQVYDNNTMTGNTGDGYVKITYLENTESNQILNSCSEEVGNIYEYDRTGEREFKIECHGTYKLEVWGASGGNSLKDNVVSGNPGYGGYATGKIVLNKNEKIYINVGGRGENATKSARCAAGGYNGGGNGINDNRTGTCDNTYDDDAGGAGGGATHIATTSGTLASLVNNKNSVLIVAGGGGGAVWNYSAGSGGGYAGGITSNTPDKYASQNIGYAFGQGQNGSGKGSDDLGIGYGGAGGGWYGGYNEASSGHQSGSGGSGYIGNSRLSDAYMYGYEVKAYNDAYEVAYLIPVREFVKNNRTGEQYTSLQEAITNANNNDILQIIDNKTISDNVTIPSDKNVIIDLNGYSLFTTSTITNDGELKITNDLVNTTSSIKSLNSNKVVVNNGTMSVDKVSLEGTNVIDNTSDLTINDSKISSTSTSIDNKTDGNLIITGSRISSDGTSIKNAGIMNISTTSILNGSYGIYDNSSSKNSIIKNSIIHSNSCIYVYSSGNLDIQNTELQGTITLRTTSSKAGITGNNIVGNIGNNGILNIDSVNISYVGNYISEQTINNSGTLTFSNNTISIDRQTSSSGYYTAIVNSGTLNSTGNDYVVNLTKKQTTIIGIDNTSILTSTNDNFNLSNSTTSIGIKNNSNNNTTIINSATVTIDDTNTDNAKGIYNVKGTLNVVGGTINTDKAKNSNGIEVADGTVSISNIAINAKAATTSNGIYTTGGTTSLITGTVSSNSATASGIKMTGGVINLGEFDDVQQESNLVSETIPSISAIGTTTGIGISTGGATYNYYDGRILGSTSPRVSGEFVGSMEKDYIVVEYTDSDTGYKYVVPKYNK